MSYFTFGVLPYFTILIFLIGMGYRLYIWTKIPQPGALTLFPAPGSGSGVFWGVVKESLLFPGLFKGDRILWIFAWIFHASLALICIGHLRVFTGLFDTILTGIGVNVELMSSTSGGAAGIIILAAVVL